MDQDSEIREIKDCAGCEWDAEKGTKCSRPKSMYCILFSAYKPKDANPGKNCNNCANLWEGTINGEIVQVFCQQRLKVTDCKRDNMDTWEPKTCKNCRYETANFEDKCPFCKDASKWEPKETIETISVSEQEKLMATLPPKEITPDEEMYYYKNNVGEKTKIRFVGGFFDEVIDDGAILFNSTQIYEYESIIKKIREIQKQKNGRVNPVEIVPGAIWT